MDISDCKASIMDRFSATVGISENVPAKKVTTFGLGAPIPLLLEPSSISALQELVHFMKEQGVPWYMLGAGSNTVFPDAALRKVVVRLGQAFDKVHFYGAAPKLSSQELAQPADTGMREGDFCNLPNGESIFALAFAGTSLINLSAKTCRDGLSGLEFGGGIPASIGGAVLINAGAHGWAIGDVVEEVWVLDGNGQLLRIGKEELEFSYRRSNLPQDCVVLAALLKLTKRDIEEVQAKRRQGLDYRKKHQPVSMPSAGSIFRNPSGTTNADEQTALPSAGKLIDDAGLKGFRVGSCEVSSVNANWIVRVSDDGKQEDLLKIMQIVRDRVKEVTGVELHSEIKIVEA